MLGIYNPILPIPHVDQFSIQAPFTSNLSFHRSIKLIPPYLFCSYPSLALLPGLSLHCINACALLGKEHRPLFGTLYPPRPTMATLTPGESRALEITERVASCFSLIGTIFIFVTFVSSPNFRRPINRLVFYASWGNTLCNIGTLMSESPIRAGGSSHLCQFQGFLIQM